MARWSALSLTAALAAAPVAAQVVPPDSLVFVAAPESRLEVHTGRAGLLGGLGHEHLVRARAFSGTVVFYPADVTRSSVRFTVWTDSVEILTEADATDRAKMAQAMREQTLRVAEYPEITFTSRRVAPGGAGTITVTGDLVMVGATREISVEMTVAVRDDSLHAAGQFAVRQTDFGIRPYRTALGMVRVADEVRFDLEIVARRER